MVYLLRNESSAFTSLVDLNLWGLVGYSANRCLSSSYMIKEPRKAGQVTKIRFRVVDI
jgi:hypothetical protein